MNLAKLALSNRTTVIVLTLVLFFGGISAFDQLSWLEDPEFTLKDALVITPYPGANAEVVEQEVTDRIEIAAQQLGQLDVIQSKSERGLSTVTVTIEDTFDKATLPQVWDELRRKVNDAQRELPPGAGPSIVIDDFSDVYGVFLAIVGPEYSYAELYEFAKLLRRELLQVEDVAKISFWGERLEVVYVEPIRDRMSQLGVLYDQVANSLQDRNIVVDSGKVEVGQEYLAVEPTGEFSTVEEIGDLLIISQGSDQQIYLRDVANIRRGYLEPQDQILHFDGQNAIGLGISTVSGGNVVNMGEAVDAKLIELEPQTPLGIEFGVISKQSEGVTIAINGFLISLLEAVAIVVIVLLAFMGFRSGMLIGFVLALTIAATFVFMGPWNIALERISLGALIIALGMLVDNSIVVVDGMLVRIQKGMKPEAAATEVVNQTAIPLLGATAVAIMAFGAIGLSNDSTGEFTRSLFQVVFIALSLSWVSAVTIIPVLAVRFLTPPSSSEDKPSDPFDTPFYKAYRGLLGWCIKQRWITTAIILGLFTASLFGFGFVQQSFFPDSTRPQFMVNMWLPQGTQIETTEAVATEVEQYLSELPQTNEVVSLVGQGALRFILTYVPEKTNSAYAQFLVGVDDYRDIEDLIPEIEARIMTQFPDALVYGKLFKLGPGASPIQIRVNGPQLNELRSIATTIESIMVDDGGLKAIRNDWRQRTKTVRPILATDEANRAGIGRADIAASIRYSFDGIAAGVFRENDNLLPIVLRASEEDRSDINSMENIQIWSPAAQQTVGISQVVSRFDTVYEDDIVERLNRQRSLSVLAEPIDEQASVIFARIRAEIDALQLPQGYNIEYWGEYRDSTRAQTSIASSFPIFLLGMVIIVIALFNSIRHPLVIWLVVPLALIGVTLGLLITNQPFGFMAILGFLSLSGMLVKNAVVLIDEIELQNSQGVEPLSAILDSGVNRLRPVAMAALTTALGLIPLLFDAFFVSMAVTIIFGLMVASFLTMIFVPVLYAIFFRVKS